MYIINTNYSARILTSYSLSDAALLFPQSQLYSQRPYMLKICMNKATLLIFRNLKVRLMGGGVYHEALFQFVVKTLNATIIMPLKLMSYTAVHNLQFRINLHKLKPRNFHLSIELFPAAKLLHCAPTHVNLFASGKCVFTGIKHQKQMNQILTLLKNSINKDAIFQK